MAVICDREHRLNEAMDLIETWAGQNDIEVNKKKSGILVIQNDNNKEKEYRGYPVKNWYKYLGIRMNKELNPMVHLEETRKRLNVYIKRNEYLINEYFSPKTRVQLCQYFQETRLAYGMCTFLDDKLVVEKLEAIRMTFMRSIMKLASNVSTYRFRLALNLPRAEFSLFVRLEMVIRKYREHFKEEPTIYRKVMKLFYEMVEEYTGRKVTDMNVEDLKLAVKWCSIARVAADEGIELGKSYWEVTMKVLYVYPDKMDQLLIRYLVKASFLHVREDWEAYECELCQVKLTRTHISNECPYVKAERTKLLEILGVDDHGGVDVEKILLKEYYNMDEKWSKVMQIARKRLIAVKSFVAQLYIKRGNFKRAIANHETAKGIDRTVD